MTRHARLETSLETWFGLALKHSETWPESSHPISFIHKDQNHNHMVWVDSLPGRVLTVMQTQTAEEEWSASQVSRYTSLNLTAAMLGHKLDPAGPMRRQQVLNAHRWDVLRLLKCGGESCALRGDNGAVMAVIMRREERRRLLMCVCVCPPLIHHHFL